MKNDPKMKGFTKMENNERKNWDYVDNRGFDSQNNKTTIKVPANADEYRAKCTYLHNQIVELTNEIKELTEAYTNKECGAFLRSLYDNGNTPKEPEEPKLRPYTAEEFNDLILSGKVPYVREKESGIRKIIIGYCIGKDEGIGIRTNDLSAGMDYMAENYTWADGDPFGIMGE